MVHRDERDLFTWEVFSEYIEDEHETMDGIGHTTQELLIKGKGDRREYSPADCPNLYNEFQSINDKQSALKFIRGFGLPYGKYADLKGILYDAENVRECVDLYNALKENRSLKGINLEELQAKDREFTSKRLKRFSKEKIETMGIVKWQKIIQEEMMIADKYRTPEQGREALMEHINKHLLGVQPVLSYINNEFVFNQTCKNLLQYIYLQLFNLITGRKDFVQCQECKRWFSPTKTGMKFCPPLPWEKKSRCANRFYVKQNRENKRKLTKEEK